MSTVIDVHISERHGGSLSAKSGVIRDPGGHYYGVLTIDCYRTEWSPYPQTEVACYCDNSASLRELARAALELADKLQAVEQDAVLNALRTLDSDQDA